MGKILGLTGACVAIALFWAYAGARRRADASSRSPSGRIEQTAALQPRPSFAPATNGPTVTRNAAHEREPARTAAGTAPRQFGIPHSLDEVPRSPGLDAALENVTKAWDGSKQGVANLNYRLERLSDIADCTVGQIQQGGYVDVLVHFAPAPEGAEATAQDIEIKYLRLAPPERPAALRCIQQAIVGSRSVVADKQFADQSRVAPMRIRFPVEDSAIYSFLETGDMKYYGNDYDGRP